MKNDELCLRGFGAHAAVSGWRALMKSFAVTFPFVALDIRAMISGLGTRPATLYRQSACRVTPMRSAKSASEVFVFVSQDVRVINQACHHFGDDASEIVTILDTRIASSLVT